MVEQIICAANLAMNLPQLDQTTKAFQSEEQVVSANENLFLSTLGFQLNVEHPHQYIINGGKALAGQLFDMNDKMKSVDSL